MKMNDYRELLTCLISDDPEMSKQKKENLKMELINEINEDLKLIKKLMIALTCLLVCIVLVLLFK